MRNKRTHRIICEALESRRLLSGTPSVQINYLDVYNGAMSEESAGSNGNTIYTYANVPLHVTGVPSTASDGTSLDGTSLNDTTDPDNAAIKAEWSWDFGDPGSEYDTLNGFNAAHIYTTPGTYPLTLTVTNEDRIPGDETIYVNVSIEPFDDTTAPSFGGIYITSLMYQTAAAARRPIRIA